MRRSFLLLFLVLLSLISPPANIEAQSDPPPAGQTIYLPIIFFEETVLTATHRSGQTFLTWPERTDLQGEIYRIYRSSTGPINATNLSSATLLAQVGKNSGRFYANRYKDKSTGYWQPRYTDRLIIEDNGDPIPTGEGLLVWTVSPDDFNGETSGNGFYAVTVTPKGGQETLPAKYTINRVFERVDDPLPVEITYSPSVFHDPRMHVYIQYMDLRHWNPTFHAPNWTNTYYGLDPSSPDLEKALQYAYDYVVTEPTSTQCKGGVPGALPIFLDLHGWAGNTYTPNPMQSGSNAPINDLCTYGIYPVDVTETWYFGFARDHDYRKGGEPVAGDVIVNFTEQRVLRMVYDLMRKPPRVPADSERIYVSGQSMGGSGTLAFAERYPNVFSAGYSSQPMTNYRTAGVTKLDWVADVSMKWGRPDLNLPVQNDGPNGWADPLKKYDGQGVWDWQDYQAALTKRLGDDMTPLGIAHGTNDKVIKFDTQAAPTYVQFNAGLRAWGGAITSNGHQWEYYAGLPPSIGTVWGGFWPGIPFSYLGVIRDETVPGLSNLSTDPTYGTNAAPAGFNDSILWSSSWNPWDGKPIDEPDRWQMSICTVGSDPQLCGGEGSQTVNVTPRRLQHFTITPGARYHWVNTTIVGGSTIEGYVNASPEGLITVPSFKVTPGGNRLTITLSIQNNTAFIYMPLVNR